MTEQFYDGVRHGGPSVGLRGSQMHRRTVLGAAVGIFGLTGCGSPGEQHTDDEWTQLLVDALEPLAHVKELTDFSYEMQGVLGRKDGAWISGIVESDTDDIATNEALLDDVGRTVATVHRDNRAKRSWVKVYVLSPSNVPFKLRDRVGPAVVTIDDLAEFYGVDR